MKKSANTLCYELIAATGYIAPITMQEIMERLKRLEQLEKKIRVYNNRYSVSLMEIDRAKSPGYLQYARQRLIDGFIDAIKQDIKIIETENEYSKTLTGTLYTVAHENPKDL